jgi:hypothetical protein
MPGMQPLQDEHERALVSVHFEADQLFSELGQTARA